MKCSKCRSRIALNHKPGVFLTAAVAAAGAAVATALSLHSFNGIVIGGALGFVAVISLGAMWTEMVDASSWVYMTQKRSGVECKSCGHINRIRAWSV